LAIGASDFEDQWNEWFTGKGWDAGLELSIATPLGPVRISYAVPLSLPEDPPFQSRTYECLLGLVLEL
jgi:outer membrane translocation and assembly module TamA